MNDLNVAEFKNNVAIALGVAILIWKDATPTARFPNIKELVNIELGRVLTHPHLMFRFPWLRSSLWPLRDALASEPWNVHAPKLLDAYVQCIRSPDELDALGKDIRDASFTDDPAFDMVIRRGKKPSSGTDDIKNIASGVLKALEIKTESLDAIASGIDQKYHHIYAQLYKKTA